MWFVSSIASFRHERLKYWTNSAASLIFEEAFHDRSLFLGGVFFSTFFLVRIFTGTYLTRTNCGGVFFALFDEKSFVLMHATIEVHLNVSEAPHLRSSIPHPKTDFQQKSKYVAANNPMAQVYKVFFWRFWGQEIPSFRNKIAETCYLYRRTGLPW